MLCRVAEDWGSTFWGVLNHNMSAILPSSHSRTMSMPYLVFSKSWTDPEHSKFEDCCNRSLTDFLPPKESMTIYFGHSWRNINKAMLLWFLLHLKICKNFLMLYEDLRSNFSALSCVCGPPYIYLLLPLGSVPTINTHYSFLPLSLIIQPSHM